MALFKVTQRASFDFAPSGDGTEITCELYSSLRWRWLALAVAERLLMAPWLGCLMNSNFLRVSAETSRSQHNAALAKQRAVVDCDVIYGGDNFG